MAPVCVGSAKWCHPSAAEKRARERHWSTKLTLLRAADARKQLAAGEVDVAAELAELLIPNIRPIQFQHSDCGIMGEIDFAEGEETEDAFFQAVVAGSPLAGSSPDEFTGILRSARADFSFGKACNTEFRGSFAAYLRRAVLPADLQEAWLFLDPRLHDGGLYGAEYPRLMRFEGRTRTPPVHWIFANQWLSGEADRSLARTRWGRTITAAMNRFWAEQGPRLSDDATVCPSAVAEWARVRQAVLEKMLERRAARQRRGGS